METCSRSPGSTGGQFAIARISEVSGSITIAVAPCGEYVSPTLPAPFGLLLDHRVEGQLHVFAVARFLHRFQLERVAERVGDDPPFAFFARQHRLLAFLDPGQAFPSEPTTPIT